MQDLVEILLFPSRKTSRSCRVSKFSTSTISLLNNARTFSFLSFDKFSIFLILLKLKSSHSRFKASRPKIDVVSPSLSIFWVLQQLCHILVHWFLLPESQDIFFIVVLNPRIRHAQQTVNQVLHCPFSGKLSSQPLSNEP